MQRGQRPLDSEPCKLAKRNIMQFLKYVAGRKTLNFTDVVDGNYAWEVRSQG